MENNGDLIRLLREKVRNREKARLLAEEYNELLQKELDLTAAISVGKVCEQPKTDKETQNVSLKRKSSISSSSSSDTSSSDSSSSSSSSSSSDSSSASESSSEDGEQAPNEIPVKAIEKPSNLRSAKRRAVSQMIEKDQVAKHKHFDVEEDEEITSVNETVNRPNVVRSEARLYNPDFVYSPNQLKRFRAEKKKKILSSDVAGENLHEKGTRTYKESYPYNDLDFPPQLENEEANVNGDKTISDDHSPDEEALSPNYDALEKCTMPKKGMMIAFKRMELSAAYTPEISDYKEASILSVKTVASELILELRLIQPEATPVDPKDSWSSMKAEPKLHYNDYEDGEERRGRFEMDLDDDIETEKVHDPNRPLTIEWSALIDVRIIV